MYPDMKNRRVDSKKLIALHDGMQANLLVEVNKAKKDARSKFIITFSEWQRELMIFFREEYKEVDIIPGDA